MINLHYEIRLWQKIYNRVTTHNKKKCLVRNSLHQKLHLLWVSVVRTPIHSVTVSRFYLLLAPCFQPTFCFDNSEQRNGLQQCTYFSRVGHLKTLLKYFEDIYCFTHCLAQQTQEKKEQEKLEKRKKKIDPRFCGQIMTHRSSTSFV